MALAQLLQPSAALPNGSPDEPPRAFPSWFLRLECERCGRERYLAETHLTLADYCDRRLSDLIAQMNDDGCSARLKVAELITAIDPAGTAPQ